ncbi:MAG: IPT/TIG domain-containing protein, partial [Patescibacteria group bacterium]
LSLAAGQYTLNGFALDYSAQKAVASKTVTLRPAHCFNNILDEGETKAGPPACGGDCGSCAGSSCSSNSQCSSGFCEISSGVVGTCVEKMYISDVSPLSGAVGTYVTISGNYFGSQVGKVYFANTANPDSNDISKWSEASIVSCSGANNWTTGQIIVEVPKAAVSGPVKVVTGDGKFTDLSNDNWGPRLNDFQITNQVRPGLCLVSPVDGFPGDTVRLSGRNFGFLDTAGDKVSFGEFFSEVNSSNWSNTFINATVPGIDSANVAVKVHSNGVDSNGVKFFVKQGEGLTSPIISDISPTGGVAGDYITITGKNFGVNQGKVWFKSEGLGSAIDGNFDFPVDCASALWSDTKVLVKVPPALK